MDEKIDVIEIPHGLTDMIRRLVTNYEEAKEDDLSGIAKDFQALYWTYLELCEGKIRSLEAELEDAKEQISWYQDYIDRLEEDSWSYDRLE